MIKRSLSMFMALTLSSFTMEQKLTIDSIDPTNTTFIETVHHIRYEFLMKSPSKVFPEEMEKREKVIDGLINVCEDGLLRDLFNLEYVHNDDKALASAFIDSTIIKPLIPSDEKERSAVIMLAFVPMSQSYEEISLSFSALMDHFPYKGKDFLCFVPSDSSAFLDVILSKEYQKIDLSGYSDPNNIIQTYSGSLWQWYIRYAK